MRTPSNGRTSSRSIHSGSKWMGLHHASRSLLSRQQTPTYDATQPVAEQYICRSHYVQFIAEVSPKECYHQLTHHVGKVVGSNPDSIIRFASSLEDGRLSQLRNVRVPARLIENMPAWFKKDGIWHGGPYSHVLNIMASYTRGRRQELRHHSNHSVRQMQELDRAIAALEALIPAADAGAEAM